jgi:MFS family permease
MVAGLFVAAIAMFTYGHSASFGGYAVSVIVASVSYTGYGMVAPNTIQTNWFPKKKALALGVSTIGFPLATMVFPITANWVIGKLGLGGLFTSISVFIIVVAIFVIFLVKTYPEERGVEPDNLPQDSTSVSENTVAEVKILSLAEVAKTKQVWLISIGLGLLWLVTVGIVSQFVNRMLTAGYDRTGAVQLMALMGFFGIFGSYLWGLIDQKIGTKKASIIYAAWYMVGLLLLIFMQSTVVIYLAVFMVGIGVGGICNLIPSYVGTIYGRENFASANRIVAPLTGLVKSTAYLYMGYSSRITGNLIGSYVGLIVICIIAGLLICFVKPLEKTN